jgi:predicted ATP-grasp superfamily ATP-dependent carboligase
MQNPDGESVFVVASNDKALAESTKAGLKPIAEGVSAGVTALLLLKSSTDSISSTAILVPVAQAFIDPGTAELAIVALNKLMNLKIDVEAIDREAKAVESKIKEIIKKSQETHDTFKKSTGGGSGTGPSMYA